MSPKCRFGFGLALLLNASGALAQIDPDLAERNFVQGLRQGSNGQPFGPISDADTAIERGRATLAPIDAATGVKSAATLTARQDGTTWVVEGPPMCPEPGCQSTTIVKLSAEDGRVLYVRHPNK